jgi:hypothetical protein
VVAEDDGARDTDAQLVRVGELSGEGEVVHLLGDLTIRAQVLGSVAGAERPFTRSLNSLHSPASAVNSSEQRILRYRVIPGATSVALRSESISHCAASILETMLDILEVTAMVTFFKPANGTDSSRGYLLGKPRLLTRTNDGLSALVTRSVHS